MVGDTDTDLPPWDERGSFFCQDGYAHPDNFLFGNNFLVGSYYTGSHYRSLTSSTPLEAAMSLLFFYLFYAIIRLKSVCSIIHMREYRLLLVVWNQTTNKVS